MSLFGKVKAEVETKAPADMVYEIIKSKPYYLAKISSTNLYSSKLLEGEWGTVGSISCWKYLLEGKEREEKKLLEAIDEENKSVTYKVIKGHLLESYKSFKLVVQVTPKPDQGSVLHLILEYEKKHEQIEEPHSKLQFLVDACNNMNGHFLMKYSNYFVPVVSLFFFLQRTVSSARKTIVGLYQ
ncbi:hypothetical protein UlMin_040852 [Ulmus minor]